MAAAASFLGSSGRCVPASGSGVRASRLYPATDESGRYAASHIQHMQKALSQMNLLLHNVVSDITGVTGTRIIKAFLAGERDPLVLAGFRDPRCKNSKETIVRSLEGHYKPEHLFRLDVSLKYLLTQCIIKA